MQKRENYLYVGMDLHKDTHTAVMVNCWNEKMDVITIENKPSEFNKLAKRVNKMAVKLGGEVHAEWGETKTFYKINVFDVMKGTYKGIMGW